MSRTPADPNDPYPEPMPQAPRQPWAEDCAYEWDEAFEAAMNKGRPCIRCGNDLDTTPGGHVCGVSDAEWLRSGDDDKIPF